MTTSIFVADVGNSTIDFAEFLCERDLDSPSLESLQPRRSEKVRISSMDLRALADWSALSTSDWLIGSVNEPARVQLIDWLDQQGVQSVRTLCNSDLGLPTSVRNPEGVGIDRLAAIVAANRLKSTNRPAVVVDAGSATTIDVVSKEGVFLGGMIAPGTRLSVQSLSRNTNQLPLLDFVNFDGTDGAAPCLIGDDTVTAIQAGVFWLVASGIDGIINRLENELAGTCDLFATGGSMPMLLPHLSQFHRIRHEPHLVVCGLATAAA